MGDVILTLQVLPEGPDTDLEKVLSEVRKIIEGQGGKYVEHNIEPFVFGMKKLTIKFLYPEKEFREEELLEKISSIEGVSSAEIVNITRAL